jgi:hypothetical protein
VACSSLVGVSGQAVVAGSADSPNTPADYASSTQSKCILAPGGLSFTGGLALIGMFQPNVFHVSRTQRNELAAARIESDTVRERCDQRADVLLSLSLSLPSIPLTARPSPAQWS